MRHTQTNSAIVGCQFNGAAAPKLPRSSRRGPAVLEAQGSQARVQHKVLLVLECVTFLTISVVLSKEAPRC